MQVMVCMHQRMLLKQEHRVYIPVAITVRIMTLLTEQSCAKVGNEINIVMSMVSANVCTVVTTRPYHTVCDNAIDSTQIHRSCSGRFASTSGCNLFYERDSSVS